MTPVPRVKDGINNYLVHSRRGGVNPDQRGTKAPAHYRLKVGSRESATVCLRLTNQAPTTPGSRAGDGAFLSSQAFRSLSATPTAPILNLARRPCRGF